MRTLTKFEQFAKDSAVCIGILANRHNNDVQLVDVDAVPIPPDADARYRARGLEFLGLIGITDGQPRVVLDDVPSDALHAAIIAEFTWLYGRAVEQLAQSRMGDSLEFLERLYRL
jgi:hypothetical protein